jgi:phenylacetate-CoA ligase
VITTLSKEALPIIRYRTRDITTLTDEPCICGRTHMRIMRVTGRDDNKLIIRGVNVLSSRIEAFLVGFPDLAPHYQIVLTREGPLDAITVDVELVAGAPSDVKSLAKKADEIRQHLKSTIGLTCTVDVKAPGAVPRSQGKAVRVKDLRKPGH